MVISAIATQGYGDPAVPEWMQQYMVMYSNGGDYSYFKDLEGNLQVSKVSNNEKFRLRLTIGIRFMFDHSFCRRVDFALYCKPTCTSIHHLPVVVKKTSMPYSSS